MIRSSSPRPWLLISLLLCLSLCACASDPPAAPSPRLDWSGADVSFLPQLESLGLSFREEGTKKPLMDILKDNGVDWIRLRLWVDPSAHGGWCDLDESIALATRVKGAGFSLLLDFHYSDWWADPGNQTIPAAWASLSVTELAAQVGAYTRSSLQAFIDAGAAPDMVQVGNEITGGMLWPLGQLNLAQTPEPWENLASFLDAGLSACRELLPTVPRMLHLDAGSNNPACRAWFDRAAAEGLEWEVIGLSYYPVWHGTDLEPLQQNLNDLASRYGKDVCVVETSYPWTLLWNDSTNNTVGVESQLVPGYPATPEGQKAYLARIVDIVAAVPGGRGKGVFWWEPDFVAADGFPSSQENLTWFDFDMNFNGSSRAFLDE